MICVYSLFNIYDLDYSLFFTLAGDTPTSWRHSFKLFKPQLLQDAYVGLMFLVNELLMTGTNWIQTLLQYFKQLYNKYYSDHLYGL